MAAEMVERQFNTWVPLTKAAETDDEWIVSGPVADVDVPDYDGETLVKAGVMRGLELHAKLGGHIDYEHQYPKTKDPKWLIGKGVEVTEVDGKPWLTVRLHKAGPGSDLARKIWESVKAGVRMGFSIWGAGTRDRLDPKRIVDTKIMMVTIAPSPKGFGQFLQTGTAPAGLYAIAKALTEDGTVPGLEDDWCEMEKAEDWPESRRKRTPSKDFGKPDTDSFPIETQEDVEHAAELLHHTADPAAVKKRIIEICHAKGLSLPKSWQDAERLEKALTTGNSIVQPGDSGGAALRVQNLKGGTTPSTYGEGEPRPKKRRKKKRTAARLEKALSDRGIRNPRAVIARVKATIDSGRNR